MKTIHVFVICILLLAAVLASGLALAAGGYQMAAWVTAGGGGSLQSGIYSLSGTIGQAEAGQQLSNGAYTLTGGFWHPAQGSKTAYLPLLSK
jgi:hypothetical protein